MSQTTHGYDSDERLPIGEAARIVGVTVNTLRRWEAAGRIRSTRTPGNQRRYSLKDVEALAAGETPASAEHSPITPKKVAS